MATATDLQAGLAYDIEGTGTPVVFLHGLTFDRRTWRPVIDQLDSSVTSIAIDLPAHGDSGGEPASLETVAERIHLLLHSLRVERPLVVGHSMAAGLAGLDASAHPARGVVLVDQATEVLPFAQMLHQIAPMLRGAAFGQVWPAIENSLGLDRIPEPARTLVLGTHQVRQDVVLGYWDQVLTTEPAELQAWSDDKAAGIGVPCLAVFGRPATDGERARLGRLLMPRSRSGRATATSFTSSTPAGSRPGSPRPSSTASGRADHAHRRGRAAVREDGLRACDPRSPCLRRRVISELRCDRPDSGRPDHRC